MEKRLIASQCRGGFMNVSSIEEAIKCANIIAKSTFCPPDLRNKPGDIIIALQYSQELNVSPLQGLQGIAIINSRPCVWGDLMLAICQQSQSFEDMKESFDETTQTATCEIKRKNRSWVVRNFSEEDARNANLLNKSGPWKSYKKRMLQMRARGFALRDTFSDLLKGLISREEAQDISSTKEMGVVQRAQVVEIKPIIEESHENKKTEPFYEAEQESQPLLTSNEVDALLALIDEAMLTLPYVCAMMEVNDLRELNQSKFAICKNSLLKKIEKNKADNNNFAHINQTTTLQEASNG